MTKWTMHPQPGGVCFCSPGKCGAPKPQWCVGKRASDHPELVTPPAGLYLTRGDGVAVEVTEAMLFAAIRDGVCAVNAQSHPVVFTSDMPMIMDELIGQEKDSTND